MAQSVKQFKIFLSSPSDVHEERAVARDMIKEALPYSPFVRGRATFDVVSWDDPHAAPGLEAHLTPQEAIHRKLPKPSECDIVIVILWGRMGTPLPPEITREDGSTYQSGTEWEFEDAANAAQDTGSPTTLLYQRTEEPKSGLGDPEFEEKREQYKKVQAFFARFQDAGRSLKGTFTSYETIDAFREVLRQHLDSVLSGFLGQEFSEELGVTTAAVDTMFAILKEQKVPPDQLEAKLKEIAERHIELTERLHALSKSNDEPEITKRREQAAQAIEQGDYDRAHALLDEAVAIDRRAINEQQEELDRRKLSAAATIGQQGELERNRLRYREAAEHFAEAASLASTSACDARSDYLAKQASVLWDHGREFGDSSALVEAVDIYKSVLEDYSGELGPLKQAMIHKGIGGALLTLGERDSRADILEQAAAAFRAALREELREREPLEWAGIQPRLGRTLWKLGERECGTEKLEQSLDAYQTALEVLTRERSPFDWAYIQLLLGNTLAAFGKRESGTASLLRAVDAYRAALEEFTRERKPYQWARIQNNLAGVLSILGMREGDLVKLEQAVQAGHNALKEWTKARLPIMWAMAQVSLSSALRALGEMETGIERLEQSVHAGKRALEEWTPDRAPFYWAEAQMNIGLAQKAIAKKTRDQATLMLGIEAIESAIRVYDKGKVRFYLECAKEDLAEAEALLADLRFPCTPK